jgi:hypothetical protein
MELVTSLSLAWLLMESSALNEVEECKALAVIVDLEHNSES